MAEKKERKVKPPLPSSQKKKGSDSRFTRTIPEPYLRGTVSIAKIDRAVKNIAENDPHPPVSRPSTKARSSRSKSPSDPTRSPSIS